MGYLCALFLSDIKERVCKPKGEKHTPTIQQYEKQPDRAVEDHF